MDHFPPFPAHFKAIKIIARRIAAITTNKTTPLLENNPARADF